MNAWRPRNGPHRLTQRSEFCPTTPFCRMETVISWDANGSALKLRLQCGAPKLRSSEAPKLRSSEVPKLRASGRGMSRASLRSLAFKLMMSRRPRRPGL